MSVHSKFFWVVLVATVASSGCAGTQEDPGHYKGEQLHFGQGGGFTGEVNYFVLLDDGRLFETGKSDTTYVFRDHWKRRFTRQMFVNYHSLNLQDIDHKRPGNLYYFIEFRSPGKTAHLISWGLQGNTPGAHVVAFYQTLYQSTRPKS